MWLFRTFLSKPLFYGISVNQRSRNITKIRQQFPGSEQIEGKLLRKSERFVIDPLISDVPDLDEVLWKIIQETRGAAEHIACVAFRIHHRV